MAANTDNLMKVGLASATTLDSNYTINDTTVTVASTAGWPSDTGVTFAIDVIDSQGVQVPGTYNEYVGTVATGTSISNVDWADGNADRNYTAGATTRVYIPVSKTRENRIVTWGLVHGNQDGTLKTDVAVTTANATLTSPKVITGINDTNGNELIKVTATGSAVNELTLANAATGNAPSLSATGGDTNIDVELTAKGSGDINLKPGTAGYVQKNGNPIDWWEELGRTTLGVAGDTISLTPITAKKYLRIIVHAIDTGGTIGISVRFNNDTGNNYSYRNSSNGGADGVAGSASSAFIGAPVTARPAHVDAFVTNIAAQEKLISFVAVNNGGAGAASAPDRLEGAAKWANTSAQITRVDVINGGTGDFAIGSEVVVLGHD